MKHYDTMTGYKATDKDMKCQGYQFKLGEWHKHDGPVELCKSGFHFCPHPSGPWAYYSGSDTRIFKVEARDVQEEWVPGADLKVVCREIRLVEEITPTGDWNTGDWNTGDWNTGNWNTGYGNTGNWNTGDWNTGNGNTGNGNTGDWNTGNWNTGYGNTGNWNTGNRNTGNGNTGNGNTGNGNTGNGNATDNSSEFFCQKEPCVICFNKQTKLTRKEFLEKYPLASLLAELLSSDAEFDYSEFKSLPGWTLKKCKELHQRHITRRNELRDSK